LPPSFPLISVNGDNWLQAIVNRPDELADLDLFDGPQALFGVDQRTGHEAGGGGLFCRPQLFPFQ
jgi:hypothetical protein